MYCFFFSGRSLVRRNLRATKAMLTVVDFQHNEGQPEATRHVIRRETHTPRRQVSP